MFGELFLKRFSNGLACIYCGSMSIKRNLYKARQHYLCKDCGKLFSNLTGSLFLSGTKYPHKWPKYIEIMVNGCSLRAIDKGLNIST